jgi:hypothetical protein
MTLAADLRAIVTAARPTVERWVDSTRAVNATFMDAWRGGYLDDLWGEFRRESPDLYLHYYVRARGLGDIKIGKTNHIRTRVKTMFTYASRGLDLIACYPAPNEHEGELKEEFAAYRLCGEWFSPGPSLITHLELIGVDTSKFSDVVPAHFYRQFPERLS